MPEETQRCSFFCERSSQIQVYRYRVRTYHTCSELQCPRDPYPASPTEPLGTLTNRITPEAPLRGYIICGSIKDTNTLYSTVPGRVQVYSGKKGANL